MSEKRLPPPDQPARDRIVADLDTNMLVEAGAGSGKTKSLVDRMLSLVDRGTPVEHMAAVTFTRKAAAELRERFQEELEKRQVLERDRGHTEAFTRYDRALRDLDGAFLGTIHAFCARLLREHPFEAGLDPAFQELTDPEFQQHLRTFWERLLERAVREEEPGFEALRAVAVDARDLFGAFRRLCEFPDVSFPVDEMALPDAAPCRRELRRLLKEAERLMPTQEPEPEWDKLQRLIRRLLFLQRVYDWDDLSHFMNVLDEVKAQGVVQKRWSDTSAGKAAAKVLEREWEVFVEARVKPLKRRWQEHRYRPVLGFLRPAVTEFERERVAVGRMSFTDLLLQTARMLRESARARRELGRRYRHLLVDEFQDTDPVQAEVCFLIASEPEEGSDWRTLIPRPGALFVVGDPKQSIYRFRRADIETYDFVKRRFEAFGATLTLAANFRSVPGVAALVNAHFPKAFPAESTPRQAAFSVMQPQRTPAVTPSHSPISWYGRLGRNGNEILRDDAACLATWIARRVRAGDRRPGDFLILTYKRQHVDAYVSALAERNIPAIAAGGELEEERELRELKLVLEALADPDNPVAVLAAVNGLLFGVSPAEILEGVTTGEPLSITRPPKHPATPLGAALKCLHEWARYGADYPADLLVEKILDDSGLLPLAASADQGNSRAGMLLYLADCIRASDLPAGITDAITRIAETLERSEATPALEPGRTDVVRVMNVHKAKGLEAPVVVLAAPLSRKPRSPDLHVHRGATGAAEGALRILDAKGEDNPWVKDLPIIALPARWDDWELEERAMLDAEWDRLLYVAVTRAKDEVVVGLGEKETTWSRLEPALIEIGKEITLPMDPPPGRHVLEEAAEAIVARVDAAGEKRQSAGSATVEFETVSETAKAELTFEREFDRQRAPGGAVSGREWGRVVHRTLEAMGRGRSGKSLETFMRAVVQDEYRDRTDDERSSHLATLARLIAEMAAVPEWRSLEVVAFRRCELPIATCEVRDGIATVTEGVMDAVGFDGSAWTVLDWKTDQAALFKEREGGYRKQVERYAGMVGTVTGQGATGRLVPLAPPTRVLVPGTPPPEADGQLRLL